MANMTLKQLARDTAILLGEPLLTECDPAESPFPSIEDRVRICAPGLLKDLLLENPEIPDAPVKSLQTQVTIDDDGMASLLLPDDFLRLTAVKMSDWKFAVTQVSPSGRFPLQGSRWGGIRGSPQRPEAYVDMTPEGKRCLRLFSSSPGASLEYAYYTPMPAFSSDGVIEVPDTLVASLTRSMAESILRT